MKISIDRRRLRARMIEEDKNSLIRALKADDAKAAKQALTGMSGEDLGLTHQEFAKLTDHIDQATKSSAGSDTVGGVLDVPRQLLGVGRDIKQSTQTHNPATGQPWSSGPVTKTPHYILRHGKVSGIDLDPQEQNIVQQLTGFNSINDMKNHELRQLYDEIEDENRKYPSKTYNSMLKKIKQYYKNKYAENI